MGVIKVMTVFGTRPEAIKMAPIILALKKRRDEFESFTVVTGQHREMLNQVLDIFHINPDCNLDVMTENQSLENITTKVITGLSTIIRDYQPDIMLVHGDTTTTLAASLVAFYNHIPIGHIEAGLRTWDKYDPYPEEINRQLTDTLADLYFAPTNLSRDNLIKENHPENKVFVTGNTAIDALALTVNQNYHHTILDQIDLHKHIILVTMHRRENQGDPMRRVFRTIRQVVKSEPNVEVIYPVHLSPAVQKAAHEIMGDTHRIHLIDPLDVIDFHNLAARSYFIMTDSGGVQEEAPSLGKPVLVLREETERPEGVKNGTLKLVGTDPVRVKNAMLQLLHDKSVYKRMADAENPYGDGHATERILDAIKQNFVLR